MEEERKRYSSAAKAIVITIQMAASVVLAVSVILLSNCVNQNMLNMGDLQNSSYVESGYFEKNFSTQVRRLLSYLETKEQFETNGVYDEHKKEVEKATAEDIERYKEYHNKYDEGSTNVYYWLGNTSDGSYITNMDEKMTAEQAYDKALAFGKYLRYNSATFRFETNIGGMERDYYQNMARYNVFSGKDNTLIIAVDTTFAQEDDFSVAKREFDKLFPWAKRSLVLILTSSIVWLFCLCYMTVVAAKRSEDRELHLFRMDKLKTEIPIAVLAAAMFLILGFGMKVQKQNYTVMGQSVVAGTFILLGNICFMGIYLSLLRRIKADTFFENSFLYWFFHNLQDTVKNRYLGSRTLSVIWIFVIAGIVLSWLAFGRHFWWAYVILIVLLAFILIYFSQRMIQRKKILEGIGRLTKGEIDYKFDLEDFQGDERELAEGINHISKGLAAAISESVRDERMKANMITNVSHDIKTPLTSIINYIGLLRREDIQNENARNYIDVLEQKSLRLKQLMEDLVEVSRISSGNITLQMNDIDLVELVRQTGGEFNEKLEEKGLNVITKFPKESAIIYADGRQLWRVIGNLYNNVAKYAMPDTRVYVEVECKEHQVSFSIKNISEILLDVEVSELTERFVRGDESRSTEGSGLGLSISKMLTELMGGTFELDVDDDLFRVKVTFRREIA